MDWTLVFRRCATNFVFNFLSYDTMVRRCNGTKVDGLDISLFRRSQVCTTTLLSFRTKAKLRLKTPPAGVASKR